MGTDRGVEAVGDPAAVGALHDEFVGGGPDCRLGVINLVAGDGTAVRSVALTDPDFPPPACASTGFHATFLDQVGRRYHRRSSGHVPACTPRGRRVVRTSSSRSPSADADALHTALARGARCEHQGQKCWLASRPTCHCPSGKDGRAARPAGRDGGGQPQRAWTWPTSATSVVVVIVGRRVRQARRRAGPLQELRIVHGAGRRRPATTRGLRRWPWRSRRCECPRTRSARRRWPGHSPAKDTMIPPPAPARTTTRSTRSRPGTSGAPRRTVEDGIVDEGRERRRFHRTRATSAANSGGTRRAGAAAHPGPLRDPWPGKTNARRPGKQDRSGSPLGLAGLPVGETRRAPRGDVAEDDRPAARTGPGS